MRADRLLSMMLLLNARGRMTAHDLAAALEVSERTVYRDVDALSFAGIPIYTVSGPGGGIFLDEDYRISFTGLTPDNVRSLFVSTNAGPLADLGLGAAVEESLLKLLAALPAMHRAAADHIRQRVYIDPRAWFDQGEHAPHLPALQEAVWNDYEIEFTYQRPDTTRVQRTLRPYGLVAKSTVWYVVGCKPDGSWRTYRVARIQSLTVTERRFERQPDFDLETHWHRSTQNFEAGVTYDDRPCQATLSIHPDWVWAITSDLSRRYQRLDADDAAGWVRLRVDFPHREAAQYYVRLLGAWVKVLAPQHLRQYAVDQAQAVLAHYEDSAE